jgi:hypothetical protein
MRILFIGSYREDGEEQGQFRSIARALGKAAAQEGHELVVSSPDELTIDPYVMRGANEVAGKHKVFLLRAASEPFGINELRQLANLDLVSRTHDVPWEAARILQLRVCDVVIALGGGSGTSATGFMGPPSQKPVLAIPIFERAGKELFNAFKTNYEQLQIDLPRQLIEWTEDSPVQMIRAAQKLLEHNPYLSVSLRYIAYAALLVFLLIASWFAAYLYGDRINPPEAALLLLLVISAAIGAFLRSSLKLFEGRGAEFTPRQLLIELTVGTLIAFALMLCYLAAGILFQGDVKSIDAVSLRRAGVATSILALAAAFLLEESTARLKAILQQSLSRGSKE